MPPPKHILDRRGLTAEDWAKGYRSKEQKEAEESGGAKEANKKPAPKK